MPPKSTYTMFFSRFNHNEEGNDRRPDEKSGLLTSFSEQRGESAKKQLKKLRPVDPDTFLTPNGTKMCSNRTITLNIKEKDNDQKLVDTCCLPFLSAKKEKPMQKDSCCEEPETQPIAFKLFEDEECSQNSTTLTQAESVGPDISLHHGKRSKTQYQVMGLSAKQHISQIVEKHKDSDKKPRFVEYYLQNKHRKFEWCHLVAHSLFPKESGSPQIKENLVAGTEIANTEMMIWEGVAHHFKDNYNVNIKSHAILIEQVLDKILYRIEIESNEHIFELKFDFEDFNEDNTLGKKEDINATILMVEHKIRDFEADIKTEHQRSPQRQKRGR